MAPEYSWDPSTNTAVESRNGIPIPQQQSYDSALSETHGLGTLEEVEEYRVAQTARGLTRRSIQDAALQSVTDEDIDSGNYNPHIAALEEELQIVQQQLYTSSNPLEQARLAAKAQQLCEQIVGGRAQDAGEEFESAESFSDAVRAELGPIADEILQNAANVLPEETTTALNENLSSGDPEIEKATFLALKQIHDTPQYFNTDRSSWEGMSTTQEARLAEHVGSEVASQVHLISNLIAAGKLSSAQALAQAAKSPPLLRAFRVGLEQGVFSQLLF